MFGQILEMSIYVTDMSLPCFRHSSEKFKYVKKFSGMFQTYRDMSRCSIHVHIYFWICSTQDPVMSWHVLDMFYTSPYMYRDNPDIVQTGHRHFKTNFIHAHTCQDMFQICPDIFKKCSTHNPHMFQAFSDVFWHILRCSY